MRYLKITLIVGAFSAAVAITLYNLGIFTGLNEELRTFYGLPLSADRLPPWVQMLVVAVVAFGVAWTTIDIPRRSLKALVAVAVILEIIATVYVLTLYGISFSPFPAIVAAFLSSIGGALYSRTEAGQRKRNLRPMFGARLAPRQVRALIDTEEPVDFSGELREASILICEIFNQEELMTQLTPSDYVAMMNYYLTSTSDFLLERGAYLEECDGESLRGLFGAPVRDEAHAAVASLAALELSQRMRNLNFECDSHWHQQLDFRVAVNSGDMILGAYGSSTLNGFSAAGDAVEFARRLCRANLSYGTRVLIGSRTYELAASELEVRPIAMLHRPRMGILTEIYEPLAPAGELEEEAEERRSIFWEGVIFYRENQWEEARERFETALARDEDDAAARYYLERIEQREGMGTVPAVEML